MIEKIQVYEEVLSEDFIQRSSDITVKDIQTVISNPSILPTDFITADNRIIDVWRFREETDEEYQIRIDKIKRTKAAVKAFTLVPSDKEERRALYEKLKTEFE